MAQVTDCKYDATKTFRRSEWQVRLPRGLRLITLRRAMLSSPNPAQNGEALRTLRRKLMRDKRLQSANTFNRLLIIDRALVML